MRSAAYAAILTLSGTKRKDLRISLKSAICAFAIALTWATSTPAQVATGLPPFGSYSGSQDIVNNANRNVHITVPVVGRAGRGIPFSVALGYDNSIWAPTDGNFNNVWTPLLGWGWRAQSQAEYGNYDFNQTQICCPGQHCQPDLGTGTYYNKYDKWKYLDGAGTVHNFPPTMTVNDSSIVCPPGTGSWSATGTTTDGSGWTMTVDAAPEATFAYNIHGDTINFNTPSLADPNGNTIQGEYTIYDTLSSTVPALTISTSMNQTTYTYTAASGQSASIIVKYQSFTVKTNFGCAGVSEYGPFSASLVTEIDLPDTTKYTFAYEATPGYTGDVTGRLIKHFSLDVRGLGVSNGHHRTCRPSGKPSLRGPAVPGRLRNRARFIPEAGWNTARNSLHMLWRRRVSL